MGKVIMALDQGTTSSRAILFGEKGEILATAQKEFPQHYPQPAWVEHDLENIWQTQLETSRQAMNEAGLKPTEIHAIGITNQRETAAIWDRATGEPLAPAIVWQCRRTAERCEAIRRADDESMLKEKTGLVADPYFSATKWEWLLDKIPGARQRAERGELACGTIDTWLIYRLTSGRLHITDPSNASRTMLFNLHSGNWDAELLDYFRIPAAILPEIVPSSANYGSSDPDILGAAVPIAGIAGDQQAALFGQNCLESGMMKNTYGTGCFLLANTGKTPLRSKSGLLTTLAWRLGDNSTFALEGTVFIAGAAVQWLRDGLGIISSANETEELAESVQDTGGVYFVPAFVGLGAPYWNPAARGALLGLTRGTEKAHLARAALEAIAFQSCELVEAISQDLGQKPSLLRVDGGATANNFLCQFQADLLGIPVERPVVLETTAAGAAFLAGLATGFWSDLEEIASLRKVDRLFEPGKSEDWRNTQISNWKKAVQRVMI